MLEKFDGNRDRPSKVKGVFSLLKVSSELKEKYGVEIDGEKIRLDCFEKRFV